jgi:3-deoxy-manno-octulosonate cytidylyltransferase (CMP-KDO synthetase)
MSYIIVIPARYASIRLPGKALADIGGRPMIEHVWRAAQGAGARRVVVATDDQRIEAAVSNFGGEAIMTRPDHASGSDRIAEVAERLELAGSEFIVNLQGDEPEMPPACLDQVAALLAEGGDVATLCRVIDEPGEVNDPNAVKVVVNGTGEALYFSRSTIPHGRGHASAVDALAAGIVYRRHIGLYAYRVDALRRFTEAEPTSLERAEALEQLRFLELGMRIRVAEACAPIPPGIDTPEDLERARRRMA